MSAFKAKSHSSILGLCLCNVPWLYIIEISANSVALHTHTYIYYIYTYMNIITYIYIYQNIYIGYSVSAPVCECTSFVMDDWQRSDSDVHWDASRESHARIGTTSSQPRWLKLVRVLSAFTWSRQSVARQFAATEFSALSLSPRSPLVSIRARRCRRRRCSVESGETRRIGEKIRREIGRETQTLRRD